MKTGLESANLPSVTSTICWSATRAIRIRASDRISGWAQASQAESGDQDSPSIAPSSDAASSVTCPDATSTSSSLPSCAAAATVVPSGEAARLVTWPRRPLAEGGGGRLATRAGDLEGVGAGGVGDPDRLPGVAEHPRQPGPGRRIDVQRARRAVLVRQPVHRPAHLDHAGLTGLVAVQAAQVILGRDQPGRAGRRRGAQGDRPACGAPPRRASPGSRCPPPRGRRSAARRWPGSWRTSRRGRCAGPGRCRPARTSRCSRCPRDRTGRTAGRR